jgi:hypothetical protein
MSVQRNPYRELCAAWRVAAQTKNAAQCGDPLLDLEQAETALTPSGAEGTGIDSDAVIADGARDHSRTHLHAHRRPRRVRMLGDVRQRLLDDPVQGDFHSGRHVTVDRGLHGDAEAVPLRDPVGETGQVGSSVSLRDRPSDDQEQGKRHRKQSNIRHAQRRRDPVTHGIRVEKSGKARG